MYKMCFFLDKSLDTIASASNLDYVWINFMQQQSGRMPGPDILRCVAAILVIAIHASAWPFSQYNCGWKAALIIDSFSRCAVPLFFMLTGYFLLCGKQETLSQFISKRFLRIFLPFVMLVFIYGCFKDYTITELIRRAFVQGNLDFHLWYVYTIIGIYIHPNCQSTFST